MRRTLLLISVLLFAATLQAQWQTIGNLDSYTRDGDNAIILHAGRAVVSLHALTGDIVRIRLAPDGTFARDDSWAVLKTQRSSPRLLIADSPGTLRISTGTLHVDVTKHPLRITFADSAGNILCADDSLKGMAWCGTEFRVWKTMPQDEHYYGFGEKAGRFERGQSHMTMWNSDIPAYAADTDPLYETIPFFYAIRQGRSYGVFMDNPFRSSFDMGKESRRQYSFGAEAGELNYYFIYGPAPRDITTRFTDLVGRMPLPPRWSLGYQQSRWSYAPEARVQEIARGFRDHKIPCDVIYLDIDYMDGYRIFTWNKEKFPDPKRMIDDLGKDGFKIAVIVDPGIKVDSAYSAYRSGLAGRHFVRLPDSSIFTGKVWPGVCAFPDFTNGGTRAWWGQQFAGLAATGIRGWWNDMNEPSVFDVPTKTIDLDAVHGNDGHPGTHAGAHNIYGLEMTRATYDGIRAILPNERPFVLTRATYAGGQRYSAAWTGDNVSSWDHLRMALPMCLNVGVSGQPFIGSDIGGFIGYPSGELFARWLQLGVFTPLMRAHSVINEKNKEPWEYGDEFTAVNRETINLRYRLLPYIYTTMYEASVTGIPAMRPLSYIYPEQDQYWAEQTAFMFGNDLLVAPVLWEGVRTREITPPRGVWYDFWTGAKAEGGKNVVMDGALGRIPVLARAGAVIPGQQAVQYTAEAPIDPLTLMVFPADPQAPVVSQYYEDDGVSFEYQKSKYFRRTFSQSATEGNLTFSATASEGTFEPAPRDVLAQFISTPSAPRSVRINGAAIRMAQDGQLSAKTFSWAFDAQRHILSIRYPETRSAYKIEVGY